MKKTMVSALLVVLVVGGALPALAAEGKADGKAIFVGQKCNMCHAVSSAAVEKTGKVTAPDLTATKHDAAWIEKYLAKESDIKGKKHGPAFKGTPEEKKTVAEWIVSQQKK